MNPSTLALIRDLTDNSHPRHLEGWCSLAKAEALCREIEKLKPSIGCEIGIFQGRSFIPMGLVLKDLGAGRIYGIDPWTKSASTEGGQATTIAERDAHTKWWAAVQHDRILNGFMANLSYLGLVDIAIPIRASSQVAAELFTELDFLHIDGNHSEIASMRDVALYVPKVRAGGLVVLDDVNWETNQAAVRALDNKLERMFDVGDCRFYRKV